MCCLFSPFLILLLSYHFFFFFFFFIVSNPIMSFFSCTKKNSLFQRAEKIPWMHLYIQVAYNDDDDDDCGELLAANWKCIKVHLYGYYVSALVLESRTKHIVSQSNDTKRRKTRREKRRESYTRTTTHNSLQPLILFQCDRMWWRWRRQQQTMVTLFADSAFMMVVVAYTLLLLNIVSVFSARKIVHFMMLFKSVFDAMRSNSSITFAFRAKLSLCI